jgi:hypothetical protein
MAVQPCVLETDKATTTRRNEALLLALLLAICAAIHVSRINNEHNWGDDFAGYIMQARGLATGTLAETANRLRFFADHSTVIIAPAFYPWGFPLLLAPIYAFCGLNIIALKAVGLVFLIASLAASYLIFRLGLTKFQSLLATAILGISPAFLAMGTQILSDVPCLFFCLSALFLIQYCVIRGREIGPAWFSATLLGLCLLMACLTRPTSLVLLPTLVAAQLYAFFAGAREQGRQLGTAQVRTWFIYAIPYAVLLLGVIASRLGLPTSRGVAGFFPTELTSLSRVLSRNVPYYFDTTAGFFPGLPHAVTAFVLGLAVLGACVRFREDWIYVLFSLLYSAVVMVWPFHQGIRYLLPLLPFCVYFAAVGLSYLSSIAVVSLKDHRTSRPPLDYAVLFAGVLYFAWLLPPFRWSDFARDAESGPFGPVAQEMFGYIRANLPEDAVIAADKPRAVMLLTNKRAVIYGQPKDLIAGVATHFLVRRSPETWPKSKGAVVKHPEWFEELFSNSELALYRIVERKRPPGAPVQ